MSSSERVPRRHSVMVVRLASAYFHSKWWFPKIRVPLNHPFHGIFDYKPSILDTPIYRTPQMTLRMWCLALHQPHSSGRFKASGLDPPSIRSCVVCIWQGHSGMKRFLFAMSATDSKQDWQSFHHIFINMYIYTYIHTYVRTYVRTYVHTYIHTYTMYMLKLPVCSNTLKPWLISTSTGGADTRWSWSCHGWRMSIRLCAGLLSSLDQTLWTTGTTVTGGAHRRVVNSVRTHFPLHFWLQGSFSKCSGQSFRSQGKTWKTWDSSPSAVHHMATMAPLGNEKIHICIFFLCFSRLVVLLGHDSKGLNILSISSSSALRIEKFLGAPRCRSQPLMIFWQSCSHLFNMNQWHSKRLEFLGRVSTCFHRNCNFCQVHQVQHSQTVSLYLYYFCPIAVAAPPPGCQRPSTGVLARRRESSRFWLFHNIGMYKIVPSLRVRGWSQDILDVTFKSKPPHNSELLCTVHECFTGIPGHGKASLGRASVKAKKSRSKSWWNAETNCEKDEACKPATSSYTFPGTSDLRSQLLIGGLPEPEAGCHWGRPNGHWWKGSRWVKHTSIPRKFSWFQYCQSFVFTFSYSPVIPGVSIRRFWASSKGWIPKWFAPATWTLNDWAHSQYDQEMMKAATIGRSSEFGGGWEPPGMVCGCPIVMGPWSGWS